MLSAIGSGAKPNFATRLAATHSRGYDGRITTTEVELRTVLAVVLPLFSLLLTIIIAQTAYIVRRVERRVDDLSSKVQQHDPRIARLEKSDELDRLSTTKLFDLMERHFSVWQDRHTSMQREMDEFRRELRSIRELMVRRDD